MADKEIPQGTHQQRQRPREGWPNTAEPEVKAGRKIRKARERLAKRIAAYEAMPSSWRDNGTVQKPGSLQVK